MLGEDGSSVVRLSEIGWLICYCFIRLAHFCFMKQ